MLKIYLTGPESSGKTTLAKSLSKYYDCPWVPEYARQYLQERNGFYQYEDLTKISKGQIDLENQFVRNGQSKLILDTGQLVLYIWSMHKYGQVAQNIETGVMAQRTSFHLLCRPDVEWEEDTLRESPDERALLFQKYKAAADSFNLKYAIVEGRGKERLKNAASCIEAFLDA